MAQHPHAGGLGTLLWYYQYTDSRVTISPTVEFTFNAHEDIMGSASYYTKQTGAVYEEHIYDAWGGVRWSTGYGVNDGKTLVIEPNYTGHSYDPILKIYHAEARFYDGKTRQWMASDPIKSGLNWYQYVESNPTTFVDPDGLAMKPIVPPPPPPSGTSPEDTLRWMVQKAQWEASKVVYNTLDYLFNDEEHAIGGIVRGASDGAADTVSGIVSMPLTAWNILADKSTYQNTKKYLDMPINERFDLLMKVPAGVTKSTQNEYYRIASWWENDIINGTAYTRTKAGTPFVIDAALGWAIGSAFSQSKITHGALKGLDAVNGYFPPIQCPLMASLDDMATLITKNTWGATDDLVKVAITQGKGGVTPVGRAFQKHAGEAKRAGTFVGEVSGNAVKNTQQGLEYVNQILQDPQSSFVIRNTPAYGEVLDVRLPDGMGARWSSDGSRFVGFLEKYTK